jgi:hypothetical protein
MASSGRASMQARWRAASHGVISGRCRRRARYGIWFLRSASELRRRPPHSAGTTSTEVLCRRRGRASRT